MPGLVAFGRRWGMGSDDLVVPASILVVVNGIWILASIITLPELAEDILSSPNRANPGFKDYLWPINLANVAILILCVILEVAVCVISVRGNVFETEARSSMEYVLYARFFLSIVQCGSTVIGILWLSVYFRDSELRASTVLLGVVIWQLIVVVSASFTMLCTYDPAGRRLLKNEKYAASIVNSRRRYKRSGGNQQRSWRRRRVALIYQHSWDRRMRHLCCCVGHSKEDKSSFSEVAKMFSEFFIDLDLVPSDILAGIVLLRQKQCLGHQKIIDRTDNDTYQFSSGAAITPRTRFLHLTHPADHNLIRTLRYYMQFALASYGWPFYLAYTTARESCRLFGHLRCCCCLCNRSVVHSGEEDMILEDDNCCHCNLTALKLHLPSPNIDVLFASFHVAIHESPFYIALDHDRRKVVVCIRGTLSLSDLVTDLSAQSEEIPLVNPVREWMAHKGTIKTAIYVYKRLQHEGLLKMAFEKAPADYKLLLVGHSLGGGAATILAIMLRENAYPDVKCYCFSAPGGLLSKAAVEYSKEFVTCLCVGKDAVIRLGLSQMEILRSEMLGLLKDVKETKWRIIARSLACCRIQPNAVLADCAEEQASHRKLTDHPTNASISLTTHEPLYPPGRIIHIIRTWTRDSLKSKEPTYAAIWAENDSFSEVLISPTMIHDHMPDGVINGIEKFLESAEHYQNGNIQSNGGRVKSDSSDEDRSTLLNFETDLGPVAPLASPESTEGLSYSITSSSPNTILEANGQAANAKRKLLNGPVFEDAPLLEVITEEVFVDQSIPTQQKPKSLSYRSGYRCPSPNVTVTPAELSTIYESEPGAGDSANSTQHHAPASAFDESTMSPPGSMSASEPAVMTSSGGGCRNNSSLRTSRSTLDEAEEVADDLIECEPDITNRTNEQENNVELEAATGLPGSSSIRRSVSKDGSISKTPSCSRQCSEDSHSSCSVRNCQSVPSLRRNNVLPSPQLQQPKCLADQTAVFAKKNNAGAQGVISSGDFAYQSSSCWGSGGFAGSDEIDSNDNQVKFAIGSSSDAVAGHNDEGMATSNSLYNRFSCAHIEEQWIDLYKANRNQKADVRTS